MCGPGSGAGVAREDDDVVAELGEPGGEVSADEAAPPGRMILRGGMFNAMPSGGDGRVSRVSNVPKCKRRRGSSAEPRIRLG